MDSSQQSNEDLMDPVENQSLPAIEDHKVNEDVSLHAETSIPFEEESLTTNHEEASLENDNYPKQENDESMYDNMSDTFNNSQDASYVSHDSNDLMDDTITSQDPEDETIDSNQFTKEEGSRRKYKRKVYDPNATREKLPRRAKDLKLDPDSDFIEIPQFARGRGRGRGRKKLFEAVRTADNSVLTNEEPSPSFETPPRGRGRGRGRGLNRSLKLKTPKSARPRPPKFQVWEEETRMSIENSTNGSQQSTSSFGMNSSPFANIGTPTNYRKKVASREVFDPSSQNPVTALQLMEYAWPLDDPSADLWMVQEQVVSFLGMKGNFKRKYPDLKRRTVDLMERNFLRDRRAVSDTQVEFGLTAVLSRQILDLFFNDFPEKYEEYLAAQSEKKEEAYKTKPKTPALNPAEKKPYDPRLRAIKATAKWNSMFNKERVEERFHCLDLQSFIEHVPRRPTVVLQPNEFDPYPVAVIPSQYSSWLQSYSPYQLKCLPLNTVLRGPLVGRTDCDEVPPRRKRRPTQLSARAESAESQSDSDDSSSSSDDSSSDSSDDSQDSSSSSGDDSDDDEPNQHGICKLCKGSRRQNKFGKSENLVRCAKCRADGHLTCWDLNVEMETQIRAYPWQCNDCKTCDQCHDPADEEKMLFCDYCDRGYHIYCVGLRKIPDGRWHCPACARCGSCGTRDPSGGDGDKQWIHEYKVNSNGSQVYTVTLCGVCVKFWRKGCYCSLCNRCFVVKEDHGALINCRGCSKQVHADCLAQVKRKDYLCTTCMDKSKIRK